MRVKNRPLFLAISLALFFVGLVACGAGTNRQLTNEAASEATVIVQEIVNLVEVNDFNFENGNLAFVDLQLGQFLQTGNLIKTHENSSARVDISIDQFTRISWTIPETIWRLGRFAVDGEAVIELHEGKIFVFDEGDGQEHWPLHIETPAGTASARGTWMSVEFDPETGITQVECLRGICELENELGYQVFTNEHVVIATAVSAPSEPEPMDEEQVEEFNNLPEVVEQELPIPAQFTQVEVISKLNTARAAAVVRKILRDEAKANSSDDGNRPDVNRPISAGGSASNDDNSSRSEEVPGQNKPDGAIDGNRSRRDEANGQNNPERVNDENRSGRDEAPGKNNLDSENTGNGNARAKNDAAPGQNKPGDTGGDDADKSRGGEAVPGSQRRDFGQVGGNGNIRPRNDEAPGQSKNGNGNGEGNGNDDGNVKGNDKNVAGRSGNALGSDNGDANSEGTETEPGDAPPAPAPPANSNAGGNGNNDNSGGGGDGNNGNGTNNGNDGEGSGKGNDGEGSGSGDEGEGSGKGNDGEGNGNGNGNNGEGDGNGNDGDGSGNGNNGEGEGDGNGNNDKGGGNDNGKRKNGKGNEK